MRDMKCVSIKNPYAYLVAYGVSAYKESIMMDFNTGYRGEIGIHVSGSSKRPYNVPYVNKEITPLTHEYIEFVNHIRKFPFKYYNRAGISIPLDTDNPEYENIINEAELLQYCTNKVVYEGIEFPLQCQRIIGTFNLVDVIYIKTREKFQWVFEDVTLLALPITGVKGRRGLWDFSKKRRKK
jgi:hypothetical protein